jgi:hypothetical protein
VIEHKKLFKHGIAGIFAMFVLLFASVSSAPQVLAQGASVPSPTPSSSASPAPTAGQDPDKVDDKSVTCAVEKIGWILCPIMEGAAKISDKAFDILADNFLRTDPELVRDDSGTKIGWEVARNLANIMFIISFLVIIFSQVTGRGLTNYGIKKMLPRLIIAAVAVNASYYICQLAVDITNILGYEIQNAMAQIANTVGPSVFGEVGHADTQVGNTAVLQHGGILALIVTSALAVGAIVWFTLPTIAALIPLILITVATIIIILLLRKAFIVLLIVISPIAFVMYLLPNTEKYFSKWMKMFGQLLMVFPIVGLLFGAGQLASTIILVAGSNNGQSQAAADCNPDNEDQVREFNSNKSANDNALCGEPSITVQGGKNGNNTCFGNGQCNANKPYNATLTTGLVATGIAVAPLLFVWSVLKGALSAAGAIGGKLSGAIEKGVRGGVNGTASGGKKAWEESAFGRGQAARKAIKQNYKSQEFAKRMAGGRDPRSLYTRLAARGVAGNAGKILNEVPGGSKVPLTGALRAQDSRLTAQFSGAAEKIQQQEVQEARLEADRLAPDGAFAALNIDPATGKAGADANDARTAAMIQRVMEAGSVAQKEAIINAFRSGGMTLASRTASASLSQNNPGYFGAADLDRIRLGTATSSYADMALAGINDNRFSAEKMAGANIDDTEFAKRIAKGNTEAMDKLRGAAMEALTNEQLRSKVGRNKSAVEAMAQNNF